MTDISRLINYTSRIFYLSNIFIYELDIQKANISVLYTKGVISKEVYDKLWNAERMTRQVFIGKLQKDPRITTILQAGIAEAKQALFEANQLQPEEILAIKNDAVYIIGRCPAIRDFGNIHFIPKHVYTGYYRLPHLELYYFYNSVDQTEYLDVKGIADDKLPLHSAFFLQFLKDLFCTVQTQGVEIAIRLLKLYYNQYIQRQLPIEHYRKFDFTSEFHYCVRTSIGTGFQIDASSEDQKSLIDISYNLSLLIELQKILSHMYFEKFH